MERRGRGARARSITEAAVSAGDENNVTFHTRCGSGSLQRRAYGVEEHEPKQCAPLSSAAGAVCLRPAALTVFVASRVPRAVSSVRCQRQRYVRRTCVLHEPTPSAEQALPSACPVAPRDQHLTHMHVSFVMQAYCFANSSIG